MNPGNLTIRHRLPLSISVLLFLFSFVCAAQSAVEINAYKDVLRYKHPDLKSRSALTPEFSSYLASYENFLKILIEEDPALTASFEDQIETATSTIKKKDGLLDRYLQAELIIQSGFIKMKSGKELGAAIQLRKAYMMAANNINEHPDFLPFKKTWGVLQILVGAVPDSYQWLPNLFGVRGSITTGINSLNQIPKGYWLHEEAQIIIQLTHSYLLDDSNTAVIEFKKLLNEDYSNPLFNYLYLTVLLRNHQAEEALEIFKGAPDQIAYSYYLAGNAALQGSKYDQAIKHFNAFNELHPGNDFKKDTQYKLFLVYWLKGNSEIATKYFNNIKHTGDTETESDRYAAKAATQDFPNRTIMQIRLATDGGFYSEAEHFVEKVDPGKFKSHLDQVEFIYRKARLYHFTNQPIHATENYLKTIELQGNNDWYFAPNSCLQLGYIYLADKQTELSEKYFRKTGEYKSYEYKKGIERKAQSALATYF